MPEDAVGPAAEQTPLAGARLDELLGEVLTRVTGVLHADQDSLLNMIVRVLPMPGIHVVVPE